MRRIFTLVLVLYSAAAFAQDKPPAQGTAPAQGNPPTVGGKPLVQVKPRGAAPKSKKPQSIAEKLQACLEIDDETKGRLDCYDAIFPPKPNPKAPAAKAVADCHFTKEEDERLKCFNGFAEKIPKF
jgi:hypothetical protein